MPKITFVNYDGCPRAADASDVLTVEAAPGTSILEVAEECGAHVGSACGGNLACSTCHVWVLAGYDSLGDIDEGEDDIMDKAFDVRAESRLGCQARLGDEAVVVEITPESLQAWLDEHPDARKQAG
ncbi:2Fe-2S iron-sulfur cluster-binding protein [Haliangium sp.]|uniref:2Fe-2S iron-sulfur cluster-binding protein n=1 Tax=Haliangium sp. TaxID=2663208 RepID=UPI003D0B3E90